jgi:hypothetical protein
MLMKGLLGISKIITYNFLFSRYYNVDSTTVDWTSLVYMVTYVRYIYISIQIYRACPFRVIFTIWFRFRLFSLGPGLWTKW